MKKNNHVKRNARYSVGIDIGGTHIRTALYGKGSARPLRTFEINTPKTKTKFLAALNVLVATLAGKKKLAGIGVGMRGTVDAKRGILKEDNKLPFLNGWRVEYSFKKWHIPVAIENDARCFTLAEARYGAGRGYKNIVGVTIGTGIGSGIIVNGVLDTGNHGGAGEIGKMVIELGNPSTHSIASGSSREIRGTTGLRVKTFEQLAAKRAFQKLGDRSKIIGIGLANIINTLDPDVIILGGAGGLNKNVHLTTVKKIANAHVKPALRNKTRIVKGKLGEFAQCLGATLLLPGSEIAS